MSEISKLLTINSEEFSSDFDIEDIEAAGWDFDFDIKDLERKGWKFDLTDEDCRRFIVTDE